MFEICYGDQEKSKLYLRKYNSEEYMYLDYEEAKYLHRALEKYVG